MEPWAETILRSVKAEQLVVVDASAGSSLGKRRAHISSIAGLWEQPRIGTTGPISTLMSGLTLPTPEDGRRMLPGFVMKNPTRKEYYTRNAEVYKEKLAQLDD